MEKKLKNQNIKNEKHVKQIEERYKEQIKLINDKISDRPSTRDEEERLNVICY
jgi:hypothetical protein